MADCSTNKNPLVRSGMNRKERLLPGLEANYVLPEEHTFADWLVYARELAAHVKYYNVNAGPDVSTENWQPFFDADVSAQLALIAVQNVGLYKDTIRGIFDVIKSDDLNTGTLADIDTLKKNFAWLYSGLFSLAYRMDYFQKILPDDIPLKRSIINLVKVKLAPAFRRLLAYYKAAAIYYSPKLVDETILNDWTILAYKQENAGDIIQKGFSDIWIVKYDTDTVVATDWTTYYNSVIRNDNSIYNYIVEDENDPNANDDVDLDNNRLPVQDGDVWTIINHVANHNLFSSIFADFLAAYARVVADAKKQLVATVTTQNTHEPHYALFLTFLHLTKSATDQLNTYTQRHLDFYYKDILKLSPSPSEANHVHLVFELANMTNEHLIAKGTAFKAGKDSLGKDVVYKTDDDIVVNKSKVAFLSSFYRAISADKISGVSQAGRLFASPIANSSDGAGAKLTSDNADWHPFVNKVYTNGDLTDIAMPTAYIGFALASPNLFLKEGKRTVTITWNGTGLGGLNNKSFDCYITREKGWSVVKTVKLTATATTAVGVLSILPSDPPVTAYDAKVHVDTDVHQQAFDTSGVPIIKFYLRDTHPTDQYDALKSIEVASVDIKVNVGTFSGQSNKDGIKELLISTDAGTADPSKPFFPFGPNPKRGSSIVIGNREVFTKPKTKIKLFIEWADLTETIQDMDWNLTDEFFPTAQIKFLESGVWTDGTFTSVLNKEHGKAAPGETELFWGANSQMMTYAHVPSVEQYIPADAVSSFDDDYNPYSISSKNGFMKIELNADFQWDDYFMALQKYLINLATGTSDTQPIKPYLPKIQSIYLSYESTDSVKFVKSDTSSYIHIYPFGTDNVDYNDVVSNKVKLMPQFFHDCSADDGGGQSPNQAEFYIGLQNVVPPQEVNLLFKISDGTTDPKQQKPKQHITWSYLDDNKWQDFDKNDINDTTQQLISTGIVSFPIPEEATSTNTILPSGYHWLRASVSGLPEEVCKLIDVKAQAVEATFFDQGNASDFLASSLPAGTITKPVDPDPSIKKTDQPYSSYGGRYQEDAQSFYTRVSERLRHKNRAITIRDIEQLVLEKFEDIHKVKCLNHTRPLTTASAGADAKCGSIIMPEPDADLAKYNEQAPGHVTVLTIPDLTNKNAIDPLRPYTSKGRLQDIEDYLTARANCNMTWHIVNPQFEEIRIETTVILTADASGNESFYSDKLKEDIIEFLTPWAFGVNADIKFGGKVVKSSILNFIEELSYIDVILELKMFHDSDVTDLDEVVAASYSILVAADATKQNVFIEQKAKKSQTSGCK